MFSKAVRGTNAAASVAEIAKRGGRAHGTFYLYFDNKRDVYSALLVGFGDQSAARFDALALEGEPANAFRALRVLLPVPAEP
jgi:AcrR family transcriptional regulator